MCALAVGALGAIARGDIGLTTHDGLDAVFARGLVEVHRAKHVAVIGYGNALHALFGNGRDQIVHPYGTVQQ